MVTPEVMQAACQRHRHVVQHNLGNRATQIFGHLKNGNQTVREGSDRGLKRAPPLPDALKARYIVPSDHFKEMHVGPDPGRVLLNDKTAWTVTGTLRDVSHAPA